VAASEETLLHAKGAMARWTRKAEASDVFPLIPKQSVFIHGKRYTVGKSLPFFVYNLKMDKKHLNERDRQRPPSVWPNHAVTVFRSTTKTWKEEDQARWAGELSVAFVNEGWWERGQAPIRHLVEQWRRADHHKRQLEYNRKHRLALDNREELAHQKTKVAREERQLEEVARKLQKAGSAGIEGNDDEDEAQALEEHQSVLSDQVAQSRVDAQRIEAELAGESAALRPPPLAAAHADGSANADVLPREDEI
jgi:hypothetical protein